MPEFIKPVADAVLAALVKYLPATIPSGYDQMAEFGKQFTGIVNNSPACFVMPGRTVFNPDAQNYRHQAHDLTVILALTGSETGDVTEAAEVYVAAVDGALAMAWAAGDFAGILTPGNVLGLFVSSHDYGPLRSKDGMLARFPEISLTVETAEQE